MNQGSEVCTAVTLPLSHLPSLRCSPLGGEHPAPSSLNTVNGPDSFLYPQLPNGSGILESSFPPYKASCRSLPHPPTSWPQSVSEAAWPASPGPPAETSGQNPPGSPPQLETGSGGGARVSGSFHGHFTLLDMFTHRLSGKVRILPNGCFTQLNN